MNRNFLLPPHFPWRDTACLTQKIAKTIPRDIDDLHVVSHCDDELYAPFGDFKGPLGFGRYDNGQSRGNYGVQDEQDAVPSSMPLKSDDGSCTKRAFEPSAAARRSDDPGVIELMVQTLPTSIDDSDRTFSAEQWRARLMVDQIDHSETFSRLPFYWKNAKSNSLINNSCDIKCHMPYNKYVAENDTDEDEEFYKFNITQMKAHERRNIAISCTQKWKISLRVGGVSSRSTLFPMSIVLNEDPKKLPRDTRKVLRPMLRTASLPPSVVTGETVATEKAEELDNEGLAYSLGSYDCRVLEKLTNPKKDFSRSKKVEVGRNRLMWSNIDQAGEPIFPTSRTKVSYLSLITGQKIDEKKSRRHTEIKVGVRISGVLLTEEALEDQPLTTANPRKRKHSTRLVENETPALNRPLVFDTRTVDEIDSAFNFHHVTLAKKMSECGNGHATKNATNDSDVVCLDTGVKLPTCVDKLEIVSALKKFDQKRSVEEKKRNNLSHSVVRPRFACVPLEDGVLRTVCLQAGNMTRVDANECIKEAMTAKTGKICSVCWSDEGDGEDCVLECVDCGVLAHANCCHDKGDFFSNEESNGTSIRRWRCAVCTHFTRLKSKPRRASKMPSRFDDCETNESPYNTRDAPSPVCSLCPHAGGAMSQMSSGSDEWAHEMCRVWSGKTMDSSTEKVSPLSTVCALCGTAGRGLTRCAARGCLVSFHPMCAVLSSKMARNQTDQAFKRRRTSRRSNEADEKDAKLCNEYTFQLVQLSKSKAAICENASGEDSSDILPVAFCGLHNPCRDATYFGCLPGGKIKVDLN